MPIIELFIRPIPDPIVIQRPRALYFRFAKKLPEIDPNTRIGQEATPAGQKQSPNVMIADLKPDSRKQLIFQPTPEPIRKEIPSPNTLQSSAPPPAPKPLIEPKVEPKVEPPPPPPPQPRRFQPPEGQNKTAPRKTLDFEQQPNVEVGKGLPTTVPAMKDNLAQVPKHYKNFQAPPTPVTGSGRNRMIAEEPKVQLPAGQVNLAILGIKPEPNLENLPPGSLKGAFSEAPRVGPVSSGAPGAKIQAPGMVVRDATGTMGADLKRELFYAQIAEVQAVRTLSAPLRPSSRMLPAAIEQRFAGRAVYTLVIPQPQLPIYNADWILWFAEVKPPGGAPTMRAPLPLRKLEPIRPPAQRVVDIRVQVHVIVTAEGALEVKGFVRNREPSLGAWILQDLAQWRFKAAERDGVAVAVEGVLEVPYVIPVGN